MVTGPIQANDLTFIKNDIESFMAVGSGDRGYGQSVPMSGKSPGSLLTPETFLTYRQHLQVAKNHQTGNPAAITQVDLPDMLKGDIPLSEYYEKYREYARSRNVNRLTYHNNSMTLYNNYYEHVRNSAWGPNRTIRCVVRATWSNENNARYFFNSGGDIRIHFSQKNWSWVYGWGQQWRSGGYYWQLAFPKIGTTIFSANNTHLVGSSAGIARSVGYYNGLTSSWKQIMDGTQFYNPYGYTTGYPDKNDIYINARKISNGVEFQVTLTSRPIDQTVDAGTTVHMGFLKATTYLKNIQNPNIITSSIWTLV